MWTVLCISEKVVVQTVDNKTKLLTQVLNET